MSEDRHHGADPRQQGQLKIEPLIFERSREGRVGYSLPELDVPRVDPAEAWGPDQVRDDLAGFPEVSEVDVVRHFTRISQHNYGIETGLHPLGSCTMKYNPKLHERLARLPGFSDAHPYMPDSVTQGSLELMWRLEGALSEITGLPYVSLQPAAGAQGELTGIMMIAAYHRSRGEARTRVLIPDSAHGTNPATASLCGFEPVEIPSNERGTIDLSALEATIDDDTAALMLTNPNTLGLFEEQIDRIADIVHGAGAQIYCDGANLNAILGKARPGDFGVDVFHINLHKTFTTPHGGGGPGCGPVAVAEHLGPFRPRPVVARDEEAGYFLDDERPDAIGKIHGFYGNFAMMVRAYAYIRAHGGAGLRQVAEDAVLAANYVRVRLSEDYQIAHDRTCMHEVVFSHRRQKKAGGVTALDICKRLIDYGFHPPTVYFPLVVSGALMVEPTETVNRQELDGFIDAMIAIAREAEEEPERVTGAPWSTFHRRLDEVRAAREPVLRWDPEPEGAAPTSGAAER
ncbi:MAG: aminomethyl-transferring glycine dehydrogenase subunit GcvPB [Acidobacteriota bacterium]